MSTYEEFKDCLQTLLGKSTLAPEQRARVDECLEELRLVVTRWFGQSWQVTAFGGAANGFSTCHSDLDVVVYETPPIEEEYDPVVVLKQLRKRLQNHRFFIVKCAVFRARVPILKLLFREDLDVDLSANNTTPLRNTRLLKSYTTLSSKVMELGIVVKLWAQDKELCGAGFGYLSSYAFLLMAIYFLQVASSRNLPCLQGKCSDDSAFDHDASVEARVAAAQTADWNLNTDLARLLCDFFTFYAVEFRWGFEVVSMRLGVRKDSLADDFALLGDRRAKRLHIEDPFELSRNLCDVLGYGQECDLRDAFRDASEAARKERYLEVLPLGPMLEVGEMVMARKTVVGAAQGYLSAKEGDRVKVLYVGDEDKMEERGWLYVQCLGHDVHGQQEGWLAKENVCRAPIETRLAELPTPARCESDIATGVVETRTLGKTKVLISMPSAGEGYLKLSAGEDVLIEYIGSEAEGDAGWLFGKTCSGRGWFLAEK